MNSTSSGTGTAAICPGPTAGGGQDYRIAIRDFELLEELRGCISRGPFRRTRLYLPRLLAQSFGRLGRYQATQRYLRCCYSVKTNPAVSVLVLAKQAHLFAEVISAAEFERALESGFLPERIVYNGPVPATACRGAPGYIFAESVESYTAVTDGFPQSHVGIRVRPPGIVSHFGLPAQDIAAFAHVVRRLGRLELGVSYHVRPEDYAAYTFRTLAEAVIACASTLERTSGARVTTFDIGGGWRPEQLDEAMTNGDFAWLCARVAGALPYVQRIFCEPGQALVTSSEAVLAPIVEVRTRAQCVSAIVIDGGYPDFPQIGSSKHRLFLAHDGLVSPLSAGEGTVIGRTCLEYDVMRDSADLRGCRPGAAIVIADAGAYDSSMRFSFGEGGNA